MSNVFHNGHDHDDAASMRCGSLIHFPPARCSRPEGHGGEHATDQIPVPLSGVAAKMVRATDRLETDRAELIAEYTRHIRRLRMLVGVCVGVIVGGCVVIATLVNAAYFVVP